MYLRKRTLSAYYNCSPAYCYLYDANFIVEILLHVEL